MGDNGVEMVLEIFREGSFCHATLIPTDIFRDKASVTSDSPEKSFTVLTAQRLLFYILIIHYSWGFA